MVQMQFCKSYIYMNFYFSAGNDYEPIAICEIKCSGDESRLIDCEVIQSCSHDYNLCTHSEDASVTCFNCK